jgi:nicotinate-nucleotide pyrophosphorylase (carboxylating)
VVDVDTLIEKALSEDIGDGDVTTSAIMIVPQSVTGHLIAQEPLVVAGIDVVCRIYAQLDPDLQVTRYCEDGEEVSTGDIIAVLKGEAAPLLRGERVVLNFIQRLSGIATITRAFVRRVKAYPVKILDTRKTTPGWRALEKYAVKVGGGENHRLGLFDAVLIKDNHISAAGSIGEAVRRVREHVHEGFPVEVETKNLGEVKEALASGVNTIMLDNMSTEMMREAVTLIKGKALVEASGGVTLETVEEIARTGVNCISVGVLTHSARAVDISLKLV